MTNILEIKALSFSYHRNNSVFQGITNKFVSGNIVGIYGKNGSGKTTLLNCLSGYYDPTEGTVLLNETLLDRCRQDIAIMSSEIDLFDYLSLEDNVKFFLEFYGLKYNQYEYQELLNKYGMLQNVSKYVFEASKGMLRKVQIIISLLMKPKLFLADEPIDGLDEISQKQFFEDIKELASLGTIVIFSLHNEILLRKHCNQIIYL